MDSWKFLVLVLTFSLVAGAGVTAYEGTGGSSTPPPTPDTACNDNSDNDGDGEIDGGDTGCVKPYHEDNSEANLWDQDASWTFSGYSWPTSNGPSVFYGSRVYDSGSESFITDSSGPDSESIREYSIGGAGSWGSGNWGGGSVEYNVTSVTDGGSGDPVNSGQWELIDTPGKDTNLNCGDGLKNDGGTTTGETNCPRDYRFLKDITLDSTNRKSTEMKYDVEMDSIDFDCVEQYGNEDIGDLDGGHTFAYEQGSTSQWDFYASSGQHQIKATRCTLTTSNLFTVTNDYDLENGETIDLAGSSFTDTAYGGDGDSESVTYCSDTKTRYDDALGSETVTRGPFDLQEISAEKNGIPYGKIVRQGGDELSDNSLTVTYKRDTEDNNGGSSYLECTSTSSYDPNCDLNSTCARGAVSGYKTGGTHTLKEARTNDEVVKYKDFSTTTETVFNFNDPGVEGEIFHGDPNSNYDAGNVLNSVISGTLYFYPDTSYDSKDQGNDPAVSSSHYQVKDGSVDPSNYFIARRHKGKVLDADGANGQSDGYIAINEEYGSPTIVGTSTGFLTYELNDWSNTDSTSDGSGGYVTPSDISVPSCDSKNKCVASVDVKTENSGWGTASASAFSFEFVTGNPYDTDASLSACKMYKRLSGDGTMSCSFDTGGGGGGSTKPAEPCGDESNEWWAYMEGPEIDDSFMDKYPGHQQTCITDRNACVRHGRQVQEGTVANVEFNATTEYEEGGSSPDWEVCLAIPGSGDTHSGDNKDWDNDGSTEDIGGEWYDLDNENVNSYLAGKSSLNSGDSNGDGVTNATDASFYFRTNDNPYHPDYNPEGGGTSGLALEDDCGPSVSGCDEESGTQNGKTPVFYSFFTQLKRDEDYNPRGRQTAGDSPAVTGAEFYGYVNKIEEDTNQLEAGMETDAAWDLSTISIWEDSVAGQDEADMWAISGSLEDSISNRGRVFNPGNVYFHKDYTGPTRSKPEDGSVSKKDRVFGNSFADVATAKIDTDGDGSTDIYPGNGTWIDPDYIKKGFESGEYASSMFDSWSDKLTYRMDISGPDSGLGFDLGGTGFTFQNPDRRYIVKGDIYFEGENDGKDNDGNDGVDEGPASESWEGTDLVGETSPYLEPPMCGDDQREYLVEEIGESENPEKLDGAYACVDKRDVCVDLDSNPRTVESGAYKNVGEPDENFGRLKGDKELCTRGASNPDDDVYKWYDQDFGDIDGDGNQDTCKQNTLYGSRGVRWIPASYVKKHPFAVRKGMDDDWNANLAQLAARDRFTGEVTSEPDQTSWNFDQESPVPTGSPNSTIATLGFCGGDDGDEQIITQRCRAQACNTDTSVIGVAEANEKSSCILDQGKYPQVSGSRRKIYQPGESVTFDYGSSTRQISCFDGVWYDEWPIVFQQDRMEVGKGETRTVSFSVINVRPEPQKYRVKLVDTKVSQFAEFSSRDGSSFVVKVPGQGAKSFNIEVYGGDTSIGSSTDYADLRVQATAINGDVSGEDRVGVNIRKAVQTGEGERNTGPRNVPGVGLIQLLALSLVSTLLFFSQS